ncbi:MAG: Calvin cycle protein CP12 [Leptolyngbya sp.]|nr:Calvin cycle protein CP12 [Leptolyngbya sp.]
MAYTLTAPTPEVTTATPQPSLDTAIAAALEHARRLTAMYGTDRPEVAIAWETVEELQTAKARRRQVQKSTFVRYCEAHPDAPECRIYED